MITKVEIENFQSHKQSVLELVPGTNVIIGATDAGKSAIFRAINWVLFNRPLGDDFRSEWGGSTRVVLHLDDGTVVERLRTSSRNAYLLNGEVFEAFGQSPPEPVLNALRIDSFNVQSQMDPPFLLSASPGEAARLLNRAAAIDEIDRTISNLRKSQSEVSKRIEHNKHVLESYQEQLKQYDDLPELERKAKRAQVLERKLQEKGDLLRDVQKLIRRAREIEDLLSQEKDYATLSQKAKKAMATAEQLRNKQTQLSTWRQLVRRSRNITSEIDELRRSIKGLEEERHDLAPETCPLCGGRMPR